MKHARLLVILALCVALIAAPTATAKTLYSSKYQRTVTAAPTQAPTYTYASDILANEVVRQVNQERAKAGLSALTVSAELTRAARVRALEIVKKFSHTRPDGTAWSTVSASAYGENIARGQRTADKVMAAWLTSQGHRANILRSTYRSIGVCCYVSGGVTYWVQLFGK